MRDFAAHTHNTHTERCFPDYYGQRVYLSRAEPTTIEEVVSTPEKAHWLVAMEKEMKSLQENDVWELVEQTSWQQVGFQSEDGCQWSS